MTRPGPHNLRWAWAWENFNISKLFFKTSREENTVPAELAKENRNCTAVATQSK